MKKKSIVITLIIIITANLLAGCGERSEVNDDPEYVIEDSTEGDNSQSKSENTQENYSAEDNGEESVEPFIDEEL